LLIGVIAYGVRSCDNHKQEAAQGRVDRGQAGAASNSAADAVNTVTGVWSNAAASEELTRQNEKEIRNAEGANDPVNPAARDAGLRSLCRRPAYRDNPKCRMLQPPAS
jgi:hypothetical protein